MPTCPICFKEMQTINHNHLRSHNLNMKEFKEQYPNVETHSLELREKNKKSSEKGKIGSKQYSVEQYNKRITTYNTNPKKCLKCNCIIPYEKKKNKFCSSSCAASLTNTIRTVDYSEEGLKSLRKSAMKNIKNLVYERNAFRLTKNCSICNALFNVTSQSKNKKTCSSKCQRTSQSINNIRDPKTFGKWGHYKGIYCSSSWELAFLVYNLDLGKDIKRCDLSFSYKNINDDTRTYFPDFLINNVIYEVKGRELDDVALKTQAVIDAGYQIELIRKKEITPIIKFLKEKYGFKDVTELYDKKV